jgi:hypothetical protein
MAPWHMSLPVPGGRAGGGAPWPGAKRNRLPPGTRVLPVPGLDGRGPGRPG